VLWSIAIDRAVREARLDGIWDGLNQITPARRDQWVTWIEDAEQAPPWAFPNNGCTVTALQAAWSAITHTPLRDDAPYTHLQNALDMAVHSGGDTDTVAAIAGGLLGARWGLKAIPLHWRRHVHGWPNMNCQHLKRIALYAVGWDGRSDRRDTPVQTTRRTP
jgi:ADP-ribosyl-[dinitrogen reductase] hydrolase